MNENPQGTALQAAPSQTDLSHYSFPGMIPLSAGLPEGAKIADALECKAHADAKIPRVKVWKFHGVKGVLIKEKPEEQVDHMVITVLDKDHPQTFWHPNDRNSPWFKILERYQVPTKTPVCRSRGLNTQPIRSHKIEKNPAAHEFLDRSNAFSCDRCKLRDWIRLEGDQKDLPPLCEASRVITALRYFEDGRVPEVVLIEVNGLNSLESLDSKLKALSRGGHYSWINYRFLVTNEPFLAANGTEYKKIVLQLIGYNPREDLEALEDLRCTYLLTEDKTSEDRDQVQAPGEKSHAEFTQQATGMFDDEGEKPRIVEGTVVPKDGEEDLGIDDIPF